MRGYYLYLITEREAVAKYLGSVIYEIKATKTYQLFSEVSGSLMEVQEGEKEGF